MAKSWLGRRALSGVAWAAGVPGVAMRLSAR